MTKICGIVRLQIIWEIFVEVFIGLVIAIVIGVLIGKDAAARGMSGIGWGIFSFVICIVAVPIYIVVRKPRLDQR